MKRYIIRQLLQVGKAKEPDIPIENSNVVVEGKEYIIAIFIVERNGNQFQIQKRFETEAELQETLDNKYIIEEG